MKAYMVYSYEGGSCEGAALAFAHTAKEARILSWRSLGWLSDLCDNQYIDLTTRLLKDKPWIDAQAISDKPHIIESPIACKGCEMWGYELDDDGLCEDCKDARDEIIKGGE